MDMKHTHTFDEAEKGSKKDPHMPADTYYKHKKNVTMYAVFPLALFGDQNQNQNQHYQGVWAICRIMDYHENNNFPSTKKTLPGDNVGHHH